MESDKSENPTKSYLFTVDLLIEDGTNGLALEKLLHLLNTEVIKDYKVKSGIELGKLIDLSVQENEKLTLAKHKESEKKNEADSKLKKQSAPPPAPAYEDSYLPIIEQLEFFKQNNLLIRMTVIKAKGIKLNLPCRILNYDNETQNVTVYHVDEKKVYLFKLNEIDDFVTG
ncbi:hypothetical protein [Paenibacillus eucommiae]|uniref:Uncharacterized protein n=1 Tax=Paenibacillus eucommiae TaxID=1355755 RepID=A0ABS4J7N2_9BACL|nr:hypothetical protein [Paenibacillus eucommiae]MBP1995859.1 hypothetical protein [Paenibacillus eucommiae]